MSVIAYCSLSDVQFVLSSFGVEARANDADEPITFDTDEVAASAATVASAIEKATVDMNLYLFQNYTLAACRDATWCKWCDAIFAAVELCRRRGNTIPQALLDEYNRYLEALKQIASGALALPSDSGLEAPQFDMAAVVTNFTVDSRYPAKIRRVRATSTTSPQAPTRKGYDANLPVFWPY